MRNEFVSPRVSGVKKLSNGTFKETVNDVVANDDHGLVLATHEFERNDEKYK